VLGALKLLVKVVQEAIELQTKHHRVDVVNKDAPLCWSLKDLLKDSEKLVSLTIIHY